MKIKAGKVVPVHVTKPHRGSKGIAPLILNLGNGNWKRGTVGPLRHTQLQKVALLGIWH